jgi:hypothetical protein
MKAVRLRQNALVTLLPLPGCFTLAGADSCVQNPVRIARFSGAKAGLAKVTRPLVLDLVIGISIFRATITLARCRVESRAVLARRLRTLTDVAAISSPWELTALANAQLCVQNAAVFAVLSSQRTCIAARACPRQGTLDTRAFDIVIRVKLAVVLAI